MRRPPLHTDGYVWAVGLSLLGVAWPAWAWPVLVGWLAVAVVTWVRDGRSDRSVAALVTVCLLRQLPGIFAGLVCILPDAQGWREWAGGVLAVWVHPLMPVLEWLPAGTWDGLSGTFWAAAAAPLAVGGLSAAVTLASRRWARRTAR